MRSSVALVVGLVTIVCWVLSVYKLRDLLRQPNNPSLAALCASLLTITFSLSLNLVGPLIDRLTGVLDLYHFVSNGLTVVSVASAQAFLLLMLDDVPAAQPRVARRAVAVGAGLISMAVLFAAFPAPLDVTDPAVRSGEYYRTFYYAPHTWIYLGYLVYGLGETVVLTQHLSRARARPLLRLGLWIIAAGAAVGLFYAVLKLVTIGWVMRGHRPDRLDLVGIAAFTISVLLVLIGSTLPSWGPRVRLDRAVETALAIRAHRALTPLWTDLRHELQARGPDGSPTLLTPTHGLAASFVLLTQSRVRLIRLITEISDAIRLLTPYRSAAVAAEARRNAERAGIGPPHLDAVIEATVLAVAVRQRRSGIHPVPSDAAPPTVDAAHEVGWLMRLARAYTRSPIVAAAADALSPDPWVPAPRAADPDLP